MAAGEPVAKVVADADDPFYATEPGDRHGEVGRVEEVGLNNVRPVPPPEPAEAEGGLSGTDAE
jgi:hypothetical protein